MSVHSLRPKTHQTDSLIKERGLSGVDLTHNRSFRTVLRGLSVFLIRPRAAFALTSAALFTATGRPTQFLKSVALIPRVLEIFKILERERPDVVHAFWSHYPSMVILLAQRYFPGMVTSISFGAYDIAERYPLSGMVAREADFVRTLANVNVAEVAKAFGLAAERLTVVYNGVDLSLVPPPQNRTPYSVLTAGRLVKTKGMESVIRAFAKVQQRWPEATLTICGSGPMWKTLHTLAEKCGVSKSVHFTGHLPQPDVFALMSKADVFLFLSEKTTERLPNVVKEAMVSGCVCVSSKTPGIEELIDDGITGYLVPSNDIGAIVERVDSLFSELASTARMRARARAHIIKAFALDVAIDRYLTLWPRLIAAKAQVSLAKEIPKT